MMQEDDAQNLLDEPENRERKIKFDICRLNAQMKLGEVPNCLQDTTQSVDLSSDNSLLVDISDALSERDKVKFTVHTKTTLKSFPSAEFSVVREHEEFVWLHDRYRENEDYGGIVIPPSPPKPDFDASREKLQKLSEGEGTMTKEEFQKMKQELEAEYLATFKKTVAMHEVFLCRLAAHPVLRDNTNFTVFLSHQGDLSVRSKNTKEILRGFAKGFAKGVDEKVLLSGHKDIDEYFENEKKFYVDYYSKVRDAALKGDKMTSSHKRMADSLIKISASLSALGTSDPTKLEKALNKSSETFEKLRKVENRVASDEDLKLVDLLKYYMRDSEAAKDLLYRRMRCLANLESANKNLDKARAKGKDVETCESAQQKASETFESISETARQELDDLRKKKVQAFKKNLIELCELQLKHAKAEHQILKNTLNSLTEQA